MKRIFSVVVFVCLLACSSFASTIPVTGTISLPDGSKLTGTVRLTLSYSAARDTTNNNVVVAQSVLFRVQQGTLQSSAQIVPNDVLQPANTWYTAEYFTSSGAKVAQAHFYISGQSFDLGSAVPTPVTTSNLSFGNFTGLTNVTSKKINNIRMCDQFTGSTAGARIAACITDLPSTGGIADARGLEGTQTISTNMLAGCSISKPVTLLLGAANFNTSTTQTAASCGSLQIIGISGGGDLQTGTTITWTGTSGGTVLFFDTTRDSRVENISIKPSATIGIGILSDNLHHSGSAVSTNIYFKTVSIGAATTGIQLGKDQTDGNNAEMTFEDVYLTGAGTYGYYIKFSQSKNLNFVRGSIEDKTYGIYHNNGASHLYGVNFSGITGVDVFVNANQDNIFIEACHDENGRVFLQTGGYSGNNFAAYLLGNSWVGTGMEANPMIIYKFAGPLVMIGNDWTVGSYLTTKYNISTTSTGGTTIFSAGNIFPNNLVFTGAVNSYSLTSIGDRAFDSGNNPIAMTNVTPTLNVTDSISIGPDAAQSHLLSGLYTPTFTNVSNAAASSLGADSSGGWTYLQVGKGVTIAGCLNITATATGNVTTEVDASLPVLNSSNADSGGGFFGQPADGLAGASGFRGTYGNVNKLKLISTNVTGLTSVEYCGTFLYHIQFIVPLFLPGMFNRRIWRKRRKPPFKKACGTTPVLRVSNLVRSVTIQ